MGFNHFYSVTLSLWDGNGNGSKSSGNGNSIYFMSVKIPRMIVKQDISDVEIKSAIECCRCG